MNFQPPEQDDPRDDDQRIQDADRASKYCNHLSTLIGIILGNKNRIGYLPGSPVAKSVQEAVAFLKDWPEAMPDVESAAPGVQDGTSGASRNEGDCTDCGGDCPRFCCQVYMSGFGSKGGLGNPDHPAAQPTQQSAQPVADEGEDAALSAAMQRGNSLGVKSSDALRIIAAYKVAQPAGLQTCNCRWNGETRVQQCTLHQAWEDNQHDQADELRHFRAAQPVEVQRVRDAIDVYHAALDDRLHAGHAAGRAIDAIEQALGMPWIQGASLKPTSSEGSVK